MATAVRPLSRRCFRSSCILLCIAALAAPSIARAQARATADRKAAITLFGGVVRVNPAYAPDTNYGGMIGADFTRYYRHFAPSIEVRYTDTSGPTVGESTFTGGLRLETRYRRFVPYLTLGAGYGSITFANPVIYPTGPYSSENSFIFTGGGGLDYRLTPAIALKFDAQRQSWKLGADSNRQSPTALSLGISIRLPFDHLGRR